MKKLLKWLLICFVGIFFLLIGMIQYYGLNTNEAGLLILTKFKYLQGESVNLSFLNDIESKTISHQEWSDLLAKHIHDNGLVNYQGFQEDEEKLNQYLELLSQNPPSFNQPKDEQLAYWINAYNAFTVKLILDYYPLKSIKDISDGLPMVGSPWDIKFFKIKGVDFDLNTIEHEIIRKKFDEPRIHFAINCASLSCPKLRTEAYTAKKLETQLQEQSRDFLSDPSRNKINAQEAQISMVFDWFEGDFKKVGGVKKIIKEYNQDFQIDADFSYMDYDWGLNDQVAN